MGRWDLVGKTREAFSPPCPPLAFYLLHNKILQGKVLTGEQGRVRRVPDDTEGKRQSYREFECSLEIRSNDPFTVPSFSQGLDDSNRQD